MNIAIIGAGIMGRQVILRNLNYSHQVIVYARDIEVTKAKIHTYLSKRIESFDPLNCDLTITDNLEDLYQAELIIECLPENFEVKHQIVLEVNSLFPEKKIGSCTSSITLSQLKEGMLNPNSLYLIHFSNPISKAKVAEIQYPQVLAAGGEDFIREYLASIEITGICVPDIPGFVLNRILFTMLFEALKIDAQHDISRPEIDFLMKEGCGLPMGPFEIMEFIGTPTVRAILNNLYPNFNSEVTHLPE